MVTTSVPSAPTTQDRIAGWLSTSEFAILEAICDTLFPSLEPPPQSSEAVSAYYRRRASDLNIAYLLADLLGQDSPEVHADLRQFLSMFASPGPSLLFAGSARPFADLPQEKREKYLLALSNSPVGRLRKGFQGIKRLACMLFYSAVDSSGVNPNWEMLDYTPPAPPPAVQPSMQPLTIERDTTLDADVVVIGSGAGGGVVAGELAMAGKSVIVLEQGGYNHEGTFTHLEQQASREMFLNQGALATKDLGVLIMAGSTLGGATVINWMTCFRTPSDILAEWEERSGLKGCFTGPQLQQSFDAVEQRLRINADQSQHNRPNQALFDGASALGFHAGVIHRNAVDCDQRCDRCNFGCRLGNVQSTMKTYLQDAYDHGARIIVRCEADKVLIENGRAVGVKATVTDPRTGSVHRVMVHAKAVVVAGGAISTPAILLRSGLENPNIGRHLHLHPTTVSVGLYPDKVNAWQGAAQSAYSDQFVHLDGNYGYKLEAAPGHPGLFALARPWVSARDYREQMSRGAHLAPIIIVARDKGEGTITVDKRGKPIIDYVVSAYDRKHIAHGLRSMARIHFAAGAAEVMSLQNRPTFVERSAHTTLHEQHLRDFDRQVARHGMGKNRVLMFSAHQMSSCRMGADPKESVTDEHQQVHGIKGLFVCDSSVFPNASGVNPMISIMGLAHQASQYIKTEV